MTYLMLAEKYYQIKDKLINLDLVFQFLRFRANYIKISTMGYLIPHVDPTMIENIEIPILEL